MEGVGIGINCSGGEWVRGYLAEDTVNKFDV